jgi:mono/diheme cytochrome c family protein
MSAFLGQVLGLALVFGGGASWAQAAPTAAVSGAPASTSTSAGEALAAEVAKGRRVYTGMCARCHGLNLAATGFGADLRRFPESDRDRFNQVVLEGRQAMPAWKAMLKPGELDALWSYIGSVNGWGQK